MHIFTQEYVVLALAVLYAIYSLLRKEDAHKKTRRGL